MFVKSSNCMCKTALGLQSPQLYLHERIYALNSFMWVQLKVLQCQNKHRFLANNVSSIYKRINQAFIFNEFSSQFFKSVWVCFKFSSLCCWCCYHSDLSDPFYSFCFFVFLMKMDGTNTRSIHFEYLENWLHDHDATNIETSQWDLNVYA